MLALVAQATIVNNRFIYILIINAIFNYDNIFTTIIRHLSQIALSQIFNLTLHNMESVTLCIAFTVPRHACMASSRNLQSLQQFKLHDYANRPHLLLQNHCNIQLYAASLTHPRVVGYSLCPFYLRQSAVMTAIALQLLPCLDQDLF